MRVYIAGPMEGMPNKNKEAFDRAAQRFREKGYEVYNPAEYDQGDLGREYYLKRDLPKLLACDAVAVLPGWRDSVGASFEVKVARMVGIDVIDAETLLDVREDEEGSILEEARKVVYGKRMNEYGDPSVVHARTAKMWAAYLGMPISAVDVCLMNILQKVARAANKLSRDTLVDIAGYAENAWLSNDKFETGVPGDIWRRKNNE